MILRTFLRAKLHRAIVTGADLHYEGSLTVDQTLMDAVGLRAYEYVQVVDIENGARFETYVIEGPPGSGVIQANGAAARLVQLGDHLIIMAYAHVVEPLPDKWSPRVALLDDHNQIKTLLGDSGT